MITACSFGTVMAINSFSLHTSSGKGSVIVSTQLILHLTSSLVGYVLVAQ